MLANLSASNPAGSKTNLNGQGFLDDRRHWPFFLLPSLFTLGIFASVDDGIRARIVSTGWAGTDCRLFRLDIISRRILRCMSVVERNTGNDVFVFHLVQAGGTRNTTFVS